MTEPTNDDRCASTHWSLPVQCVLKSTHTENWHEAWHPETGNRLRYRYPGSLTEELHHDAWHRIDLPKPGGAQVAPTPVCVWSYNDEEGEGASEAYATEMLARVDAEKEYIDNAHTDPSNAGVLSWSPLPNTPDCQMLLENGQSVGVHLWRSKVIGAAPEPDPIATADQLRALPVGAVLLDGSGGAWQICSSAADPTAARYLGSVNLRVNPYWLATDQLAASDAMSAYGPFRVLHTPEEATS